MISTIYLNNQPFLTRHKINNTITYYMLTQKLHP